jgi:cytidine deaminase
MVLQLASTCGSSVPRIGAELALAAEAARLRAYAPYSGFAVGAAVRTSHGLIYAGCNVENASYGLTICAERVAICLAASLGERRIDALAVSAQKLAHPCGACLQVLSEFAGPDCWIFVARAGVVEETTTLGQLLPKAFALRREGEGSCTCGPNQ